MQPSGRYGFLKFCGGFALHLDSVVPPVCLVNHVPNVPSFVVHDVSFDFVVLFAREIYGGLWRVLLWLPRSARSAGVDDVGNPADGFLVNAPGLQDVF